MSIQLTDGPMMEPREIAALRDLLTKRRPRRVLEWGSGGSTLTWPVEFPEIEWWTLEHNRAYYDGLRTRVSANVHFLHLAFPAYYEISPQEFGLFDLIIVDGRQRVKCLNAARSLLAPGGVVVLHDSSRERYKPAWDYYRTTRELSPPNPERGKDQRGLTLFADPRPLTPDGALDCGVVYMAWGENAILAADTSIHSLRRFEPEMPVFVTGDAHAVEHFADWYNVTARLSAIEPFDHTKPGGQKFLAGRVKPKLCELVPWERVLYVDADTDFTASPRRGFDLLDKWEFVIAETKSGTVATSPFLPRERQATVDWLGNPYHIYHNSGMLFWRRCPAAFDLMRLWSEEWQRYGDWDEQVALLRALLRSDVLFLVVPFTWNTLRDATLLHHSYGTHKARIEPSGRHPRGIVQTNRGPRTFEQLLTPEQRKRKTRLVEVVPGVVTKLHGDDATSARARLAKIVGEEIGQ